MALHTLEIFAGVGMLGEGLRAGLAYLGVAHRTVCYVEREAHPASVMAARCEEGSLDAAPVWSDLLTFDAAAWHGAVDCIAAGFPCQDLSLAGRRAGLDGKRSGLFFNILDIADACGARFLFLENVAGIASATASVVDEASTSSYAAKPFGDGFSDVGVEDGRLLERAAARVLGELADRGWDAEWLPLSASDVGASHGRARWFCWAWRRQVDDTGRLQRRAGHEQDRPSAAKTGQHEAHDWPADGSGDVAHPQRAERRPQRIRSTGAVEGHDARGRQEDGGPGIADAVLGHTGHERTHRAGRGAEQDRCAESADADGCLADATRHGRHPRRAESGGVEGRPDAAECSGAVADAGRSNARRIEHIAGASRFTSEYHAGNSTVVGARLFAPGPSDTAWGHIITRQPELAPALEPAFRSVVNGLAFDMDDSRAARLKCVGNGVVPLCAAAAFIVLFRRSGVIA